MSDHNIYILVGRKIRKLREDKGFTQQYISDICDFEKSTISRIEAGRTNITLKNIHKLSQALGVQMKDLVDIE